MTFKPRIYLIFALLLILAGCSMAPEPVSEVQWQSHQARLANISQFRLSGKMGYISPEQRESFNFQWQKKADSSQLRLTNFLGQTILNLTISAQGARVETYDDQVYTADNAEQLIWQLTGLDIPINLLQDWILGLPSQADQYQLNSNNTLQSLDKTAGNRSWHVDYARYREYPWQSTALPLPDKLKLTQRQTAINLVVSKWTLTP
ncbi:MULTISPECIES: lipoprotein insertase outer membrane protein LolB [Vibrio]|uniref:Outer-membrane lipoprotein LolB n=1 Tax=Vibrio ostreae TaxID=2841925 RepID=A0A975UA55_9VIBR|nr:MULTISPECIES: lipoprotein insertase outer membrane protein LolB [Vibrio]QXO18054.1 lipoprotein insertase outer membrane protein LolB [Vibrio ostreae]WGY47623.1 lipoprotein localization protein LolB [Vibrio sp. ABG19]